MTIRYIFHNQNDTMSRIIVAMIEGKDDFFIEHLMGIFASEHPDSGAKGNLQEFLYSASIAQNIHWMRKLTLRGATDMNTQTTMTNFQLDRFESKTQNDRIIVV